MPEALPTIDAVADAIETLAREHPAPAPAPIVAISGIDASGKSWLAATLTLNLARRGLRIAPLSVDPWHTARDVRFAGPDWGRTFYERSFRWIDLRRTLLEPLRSDRSIDITMQRRRIADDALVPEHYAFDEIDLILFEGIFAHAADRRDWFDRRLWIDCTFDSALERALARNQEGLSPDALRDEYERVYWPAQRLHISRDHPREHAHWTFDNERD